jgi:hypothetical protein
MLLRIMAEISVDGYETEEEELKAIKSMLEDCDSAAVCINIESMVQVDELDEARRG